jgi:anti-anti-sigma factor
MTSFHESASAALVDKSEVPVIRESFSQDAQLSFDDVESFDEWLSAGDYARNVLLSLEDLTSIDSHRIGWLVTAHKRFCQEGGKLAVHSIRPQAMETVRFLGLDRVLHVADDEAAALRLF